MFELYPELFAGLDASDLAALLFRILLWSPIGTITVLGTAMFGFFAE